MKGIVAALAGATLLLAFACADDETEDKSPNGNIEPEVATQRALDVMKALRSYRLTVIPSPPSNDPLRELRWVVEFVAPDTYRSLEFDVEGESEEVCESYTDPENQDLITRCYPILTSVTRGILYERISSPDRLYFRECTDVDKDCSEWERYPLTSVPVAPAGPSSTYLPQWPLVALEMAQDLQFLGIEEFDGDSLVHLRGVVNPLRAVLENQRRVYTAAGVTSYGVRCEGETVQPGEEPAEQTCRELTYEDVLEKEEPKLISYDRNPATIDIWLSPEDFIVHRISVPIPQEEPRTGEIPLDIRYSLFNEVVIEPPQ